MAIKKEAGPERTFSTGAHRQAAAGKGTPVLFPGDAYLEISKHFEEGADVHGARNWEKGLPLSNLIDSLERHIAQEKLGMTDESHARAIAWNAVTYLATKIRIERGQLPAELADIPGLPEARSHDVPPAVPTPEPGEWKVRLSLKTGHEHLYIIWNGSTLQYMGYNGEVFDSYMPLVSEFGTKAAAQAVLNAYNAKQESKPGYGGDVSGRTCKTCRYSDPFHTADECTPCKFLEYPNWERKV